LGTDAVLELDSVVAGYGKMTILNGTSFRIRGGAITTIIGPNGAGKSTVFKTVFGLLRVRSGRVSFLGRDITSMTPRQLLELGICYVPQGRNIFPELSVRHNLELGGVALASRRESRARTEAAMDRFPMLRRKADAQASTLSGGEQKLLEIARGLLLDPKLILIDEPSIGLSPILTREVLGIVRALRNSGVTILMVEQNAKSALEISDEGIVLELGQVRRQDDAASILADPRIGHLFLGGSTGAAAAS
jgi:branched-chain amino acid transport system ATP-binding protein